jgi:hypothetical protein
VIRDGVRRGSLLEANQLSCQRVIDRVEGHPSLRWGLQEPETAALTFHKPYPACTADDTMPKAAVTAARASPSPSASSSVDSSGEESTGPASAINAAELPPAVDESTKRRLQKASGSVRARA